MLVRRGPSHGTHHELEKQQYGSLPSHSASGARQERIEAANALSLPRGPGGHADACRRARNSRGVPTFLFVQP